MYVYKLNNMVCPGFSHRWGRNGEFCATVSPVIRTTDTGLCKSYKKHWLFIEVAFWMTCTSLIGVYQLKMPPTGSTPTQQNLLSMHKSFSFVTRCQSNQLQRNTEGKKPNLFELVVTTVTKDSRQRSGKTLRQETVSVAATEGWCSSTERQ